MTGAAHDLRAAGVRGYFESERAMTNEQLLDDHEAAVQAAFKGASGAHVASTRAAVLARMTDGWQPIAAAPKDGTVVLSCSVKRRGFLLACFDAEYDEWQEAVTGRGLYEHHQYDDRRPTHWRPLPATPEAAP